MQVRRAEGRRRLHFLAVALGLVALAVAAWGITRTPLLDLDHVRIDGVAGDDALFVEKTAALETGTAMFDLDLGEVERSLEAVPWIESATASRDWPGSVQIDVEVRVAVAQVGSTTTNTVLADRDGVLIRRGTDEQLPLVKVEPLVGLGEIDTRALVGIEVALALPDDLRIWVEAVTIDGGGANPDTGDDDRLSLGLDLIGSANARLGSAEFVADKLDAVRTVLQGADLACVGLIDVVVADFPVMTRREDCVDPGAPTDGGADA